MKPNNEKVKTRNNYVDTAERLPRFDKSDSTPKVEIEFSQYFTVYNAFIEGLDKAEKNQERINFQTEVLKNSSKTANLSFKISNLLGIYGCLFVLAVLSLIFIFFCKNIFHKIKHKLIIVFLVFFIFTNSVLANSHTSEKLKINENFHPPQTQAEKTLDVIFRMPSFPVWKKPITLEEIKQVNQKFYEFALQNGIKGHSDKTEEFMLTKELLNAIEQARIEGQKDCLPGDQCTPDYDIISCSQDDPNYEYYTTKEEKNIAYVSWNQSNSYKIIKVNNEWKLDGIKCRNDFFNYPSPNPAN